MKRIYLTTSGELVVEGTRDQLAKLGELCKQALDSPDGEATNVIKLDGKTAGLVLGMTKIIVRIVK